MRSKVRLLAGICFFCGAQVHAEKLNDILNQITADLETSKSSGVADASPGRPPKSPAQDETQKQAESKPQTSKPREKKSPVEPKRIAATPEPRIVVYKPKDKLPKDVAGCGVAGDFLLAGEDTLGGARIIPAEDDMNPFARVFIIKNLTSGYSPGTFLRMGNRRLLTVSAGSPLIFIGRGMLPGEYLVRSQR